MSISSNTNYTVYKHVFPNGKVYVGITSQKVERRWRNGLGYRNKQDLIYRAILKYGWENIVHDVLCTGLSKEEAEKKEVELILFYNSTNPAKGYNVESGGNVHKHLSEATKEKLRQANLGKRHSEETKRKISASNKGKRTMTQEQLRKMRLGRKYNFTPWNKGKTISTTAVVQYDKEGNVIKEYINCHDAQKQTNISHIYAACKGKRKTAGGFVWKLKI